MFFGGIPEAAATRLRGVGATTCESFVASESPEQMCNELEIDEHHSIRALFAVPLHPNRYLPPAASPIPDISRPIRTWKIESSDLPSHYHSEAKRIKKWGGPYINTATSEEQAVKDNLRAFNLIADNASSNLTAPSSKKQRKSLGKFLILHKSSVPAAQLTSSIATTPGLNQNWTSSIPPTPGPRPRLFPLLTSSAVNHQPRQRR